MPDEPPHPPVYQAVVLSQTLKEFEWQHKNKLLNLKVAGQRHTHLQPSITLENLDKQELGLNQEKAESEQQRNSHKKRESVEGELLTTVRDGTENIDSCDKETYDWNVTRQPEGTTSLQQSYNTLGAE